MGKPQSKGVIKPLFGKVFLILATMISVLTFRQALGILKVLCELTKSGGSREPTELSSFRTIVSEITSNKTLDSNTLVRKWNIKLTGRLALSELPRSGKNISKKRESTSDPTMSYSAQVSTPQV